jgi:hemerythrin
MDYGQFIEWNDHHLVGIELIDEQHRELLSQMNNLYLSCQKKEKEAQPLFKTNIRLLLRYITYHFSTEEKVLKHIKYPDLAAHSKQHAVLTKIITEGIERIEREEASALFPEYKPLEFVAYLRDKLINHIAIVDKKYVSYIHFVNRRVETYAKASTFSTNFLLSKEPFSKPG